ncbi:MAG: phage late control D family protein [Aeromonas sobria]|uniref:phage late control D family protein n=1 Tax=Aeromonas sobria TaxID=646 RepID=UPI003F38284D
MKRGHYRVVAEGADITALISDRFISLTLTDNAGEDSDTFSLTLDNRDDKLKFPGTGTKLRIFIGPEGSLMDKGLYTVDEISEGLEIGDLEISGKATDTKGTLKAQKTRTWAAQTLGAMARKIAGENGYGCTVNPRMDGIKIPATAQKAESDMNLLTRLCKKHSGLMKVGDGKVLITPKGSGETASGEPLPVVVISDPSESTGRVTLQERGTFGAVVVSWFDAGRQANVSLTVNGPKDGPTQTLKGKFRNQEEAIAAATAFLEEQDRGKATMSMVRPLTPDIVAPGKVRVTGHRQSANGSWFVESATHYVGSGSVSSTSLSLTTEEYDAEKPKK